MMKYRQAALEDAPGIAGLHAESWRRTYRGNFRDAFLDGDVFSERRNVWTDRLGNPPGNQFVCVAESEGRICGFICAYAGHDAEWGSFIDNLHVDKPFHGQGVGTQLMSQAGSWLAGDHADISVYLEVWISNPALKFYERLGGRRMGIVETENPGGGSGNYFRMAWQSPLLLIR